ncbi:MAG: hypothetical protein SPJ13_02910 [Bacteroidales bacterium]|nr:hypothetical protein [Bacteroidales bacterium]
MDLTLNIKEGLGNVNFDMPVEEVCRLLGEATSVENINNVADEATTVLHYDENHVTLFFEGNEPRLQCIDICNPNCELFGKRIFNMGKKELVSLMVEHKYWEQDMDKEEWGEERISFLDGNIDFYFNGGKLTSVIVGK